MKSFVWGLLLVVHCSAASYTVSFSAQTSVTVLGSVHNLGTPNLDVACYDTTVTPWASVKPGGWTVDPTVFDVVITFTQPQTGRCTLLAAQIDAEANQVRGSAGALSCTFANVPPSNVVTRACADHHGFYGLPWSHPMDFGQDKAGRETDNGSDVVFDLHFVGGVMSWDFTVTSAGAPALRGRGVFTAPPAPPPQNFHALCFPETVDFNRLKILEADTWETYIPLAGWPDWSGLSPLPFVPQSFGVGDSAAAGTVPSVAIDLQPFQGPQASDVEVRLDSGMAGNDGLTGWASPLNPHAELLADVNNPDGSGTQDPGPLHFIRLQIRNANPGSLRQLTAGSVTVKTCRQVAD